MDVKIQGFEWRIRKGITIEQLYSYLNEISGIEDGNRLFALTNKSGYLVGVFLTIKDTKAYCQIKQEGGSFKITPRELEEGASMVDFNFFLLHKTTGRGLYQYYAKSASANTFSAFIKKKYNRLKKRLIDSALESAGGEDLISKKEARTIKSKYGGIFTYSTIVRPDSFEDYVNELKRIKSFSYEVSTIDYSPKDKVALHRLADRKSYKLFFSNDMINMSKVKEAIVDMNPSKNFKRATVVGIDDYDQESVYKLLNDYESYAAFDYNDIIKTVDIDSTNIIESIKNAAITKTLINLANGNRQVNAIISKEFR